jgi:hypothetical protein
MMSLLSSTVSFWSRHPQDELILLGGFILAEVGLYLLLTSE